MDNEELFNKLIDEKLGLLRSVAFRLLKNQQDADDAVQSALLKAWARRDSFRGDSALLSWAYRITVNESMNLLRSRKRETERKGEWELLRPENQPKHALERLESLISELPTALREAVELVYVEQMAASEVAQMLACNVNALYQRLHKARQMLKEKMADE